MSKALDYLLAVRGEAMHQYFGFFKDAGKHLDPRTRAIISVITKVDNQTVAGFRQYLKRALAAGVSADELLDALLVAMPTLGLSKVTWAVDQILAMDLPEFRADALGATTSWRTLCAVEAVQPGVNYFRSGNTGIFVINGGGSLRCFDSRCPHQGTDIPASGVCEQTLRCPKHGWEFDLASGRCISGETGELAQVEHKMENAQLWIKV